MVIVTSDLKEIIISVSALIVNKILLDGWLVGWFTVCRSLVEKKERLSIENLKCVGLENLWLDAAQFFCDWSIQGFTTIVKYTSFSPAGRHFRLPSCFRNPNVVVSLLHFPMYFTEMNKTTSFVYLIYSLHIYQRLRK